MATGRPKGSGLTAAIVAAKFAEKLQLDLKTQKDAYYLASVRFIGCTITSHETGMMSINRYRLNHQANAGSRSAKRVVELLELVGVPEPKARRGGGGRKAKPVPPGPDLTDLPF